MTNFEKIKNMSIEEIADKLNGLISSCECCPIQKFCDKDIEHYVGCMSMLEKWLKSEAENNNENLGSLCNLYCR